MGDHEAGDLKVQILALEKTHEEEKAVEEQRLKHAQHGYDEAVKKHHAARHVSDRSTKAAHKLTADSDFANKTLKAAKAQVKRLKEMIARMVISVEIAEHWRNQEVEELKAKIADRAEKTAAEHLAKASERYAKTVKGVQKREMMYNDRMRVLDLANERLKETQAEAEAAEDELSRMNKLSVDWFTQQHETELAHTRQVAEEKSDMHKLREEQLATVQLKVNRAKLALDKAQSTSATAEGRVNALQMLVEKHKTSQAEARLAMMTDQEAERSLREELQELEAIELTEVVPIQPPPKKLQSTPVAKSSHWTVVQNVSKFLSKVKHSSKNDPHKLAPPDQRDALSEVCEQELAAMHLSLEEPIPEEAEQDIVDRWTLKYKYKYMYKYRARDIAAALSTQASSMLGPVWDPVDPAVHSPPSSPKQDKAELPAPSSPTPQQMLIDLSLPVDQMDIQEIEAVQKQAQKQVSSLMKEANLLPLTRKQERAQLAPILKDRRNEAAGWGQLSAAMQSVGEEEVRQAVACKGETMVWSGNVAWIAQWLMQSMRLKNTEQTNNKQDQDVKLWNNSQDAYQSRSQDAHDRRIKAIEENKGKEQNNSFKASHTGPKSPQNDPPSPGLTDFHARLQSQQHNKPSDAVKKSVPFSSAMLSPAQADTQHLLTTYYESKDVEYAPTW